MDTLTTADGLALHRRRWPAAAPARGTVLLVHGLGEHAGRYDAVAAALNQAGWQVEAYDQRGHGLSGGAHGVIPAADSLLADLALAIDTLRREAAPGPLVLLGHSMGGAVAARFVAESLSSAPAAWSRPVDALALSSPALAAKLRPVQRLQLALGHRLVPGLAVANGIDADGLARDPAVRAAYEADPLVHDRICPRLARFILDAGEAVRAAAPHWRVPTLLMWGEDDPIVDAGGSRAFAAAAPAALLEARAWAGLRHELFNELERAAVLQQLTDWLARQAPTSTPAPAGS